MPESITPLKSKQFKEIKTNFDIEKILAKKNEEINEYKDNTKKEASELKNEINLDYIFKENKENIKQYYINIFNDYKKRINQEYLKNWDSLEYANISKEFIKNKYKFSLLKSFDNINDCSKINDFKYKPTKEDDLFILWNQNNFEYTEYYDFIKNNYNFNYFLSNIFYSKEEIDMLIKWLNNKNSILKNTQEVISKLKYSFIYYLIQTNWFQLESFQDNTNKEILKNNEITEKEISLILNSWIIDKYKWLDKFKDIIQKNDIKNTKSDLLDLFNNNIKIKDLLIKMLNKMNLSQNKISDLYQWDLFNVLNNWVWICTTFSMISCIIYNNIAIKNNINDRMFYIIDNENNHAYNLILDSNKIKKFYDFTKKEPILNQIKEIKPWNMILLFK